MRNKQLLVDKLRRVEGKLKAIRVLVTRPNTLQEVNDSLNQIEELMEDVNSIIEREL